MLKSLFGRKKEARGALTKVEDLQVGDIVKFGFLNQADLSNLSFEVVGIDTHDFENNRYPAFRLKGPTGDSIWISGPDEEEEGYFSVSKKLSRSQVSMLFDAQDFQTIFDEGFEALERADCPEALESWTAPQYAEVEDCVKGYYHRGDFRGKDLPKYEDQAQTLDYYLLEDPEEECAIEIEVYTNGDTEVYATRYLENASIDEFWPADTQK